MDSASYVAASGGLIQFRKLEVVNNNLANINTVGYKREILVEDQARFDQTLASAVANRDPFAEGDFERTPAAVNARAVTDFSPGAINATGNPLDVALRDPKSFFVVEGPNGPEYTRAGNFSLNAQSEIVTPDGARVMGDGGPITAAGVGLTIQANGAVEANNRLVGRLQVVRVDDPTTLERAGNSRFKVKEGSPAPVALDKTELVPRSLEMSNVGAITSVVDLISAQRGFQLYTKTAESIDQLNQAAITQIGRR